MRKSTLLLLPLAASLSLTVLSGAPESAMVAPPARIAADLLGREATELAWLIGPPNRIVGGGRDQRWYWGQPRFADPDLVLVDGRVVFVREGFDPAAHPMKQPRPIGPYLGQPVEELLRSRGGADRVGYQPKPGPQPGTVSKTLPPDPYIVYGEEWVFVEGDVVVGITPPIIKKSNGPGR